MTGAGTVFASAEVAAMLVAFSVCAAVAHICGTAFFTFDQAGKKIGLFGS